MSPEFMDRLPQFVLYMVFFSFVASFVLSKAAEASESFAKLFGPLGKFWRRKIDQERADRIQVFKQEARIAVDSELGVTRKTEYAALKKQLADVLDRVEEMERNESVYEAYLVTDAQWHREINIRLAEMGVLQAPLPDRIPFSQFEEDYRKQRGWQKPSR